MIFVLSASIEEADDDTYVHNFPFRMLKLYRREIVSSYVALLIELENKSANTLSFLPVFDFDMQ